VEEPDRPATSRPPPNRTIRATSVPSRPPRRQRCGLIRLNQIMRGWANYFKHAVCKHTLHSLAHFVWWRVVQWLRTLHRWR